MEAQGDKDMTNEEAILKMNEIQQKVFNDEGISVEERNLFRMCWRSISESGCKVVKHHSYHPSYKQVWYSFKDKAVVSRAKYAEWVKFAPPCDHHNECTTRGLFFCLEEKIPYDDIRKEQNARANRIFHHGRCYGWNHGKVWESVLTDRGYVKVNINGTIRRDKLASLLKDCGRILTHSSGHCAAIFEGRVYDSWDSTGGRVDYILVKREMMIAAKSKLEWV